jgi:hypothetical protein
VAATRSAHMWPGQATSHADGSALKSISPPGGQPEISQFSRDGVAVEMSQEPLSEAGTARPRRRRARVTATYATRSASATSGSDALPGRKAGRASDAQEQCSDRRQYSDAGHGGRWRSLRDCLARRTACRMRCDWELVTRAAT